MDTRILEAQPRTIGKGPARRLRSTGSVPAILYGHQEGNIALQVNARALEDLFGLEESLHQPAHLALARNGKTENMMVLLKEYQADIIKRHFTHLDFLRIEANEKVEVAVPVRFTGKSKGVKEGGIMKSLQRFIKLSCLPKDIPVTIECDVTALDVGDVIHIKQIALPQGCVLVARQGDFPLVTILGKPAEEEVAPAPTAAAAPAAAGAVPATAGGAASAAPGAAAAPAAAGKAAPAGKGGAGKS